MHWHGLRVPNAHGWAFPGLTQSPIAPGGNFEYRFRLPDAGTFWLHPRGQPCGAGPAEALRGVVDRGGSGANWRSTATCSFSSKTGRSRVTARLSDASDASATITINAMPSIDLPVRTQRAAAPAHRQRHPRLAPWRCGSRGHEPTVVAIDGQPSETVPGPRRPRRAWTRQPELT